MTLRTHEVAHHGSSMSHQRGATMISVMLLTVTLLTVGMLAVRSSTREIKEASALISRERALMAAQAGVDLAVARLRVQLRVNPSILDTHLTGQQDNKPSDLSTCAESHKDCIPGQGNMPNTGQRNTALTGKSACAGRPCMRPGAILRLPDSSGTDVDWADQPMADLLTGSDPDARLTVWIRNNSADALGGASTAPGSWTDDRDSRVVLTALASLRNTTVAIEQEMLLSPGDSVAIWQMQSPDEGYGVGHNNDNAAVDVCKESYLTAVVESG